MTSDMKIEPVHDLRTHVMPDRTFVEIEGTRYGAWADERGPIGGGDGYTATVTGGQRTATTVEELAYALGASRAGDVVFVPGDAFIDCTTLVHIDQLVLEIPAGVTLAGDRGVNGSRGAVICSDEHTTKPLFRAMGPNVRVTGLRLYGPDPKQRREHNHRAFSGGGGGGEHAPGNVYYYKFPVSAGILTEYDELEVDNCEMCAWSHRAVGLVKGSGHHIHHNEMHHCWREGLGYAVSHEAAESLIERNLFYSNRHSLAGTGEVGCSYEAMHNVELHETTHHCFDMHGGEDRGDGTDIAGTWLKIHHNYFDSPSGRAVMIRGSTQEQTEIHHNWWSHQSVDRPVHKRSRTDMRENAYGPDDPKVLDADGA